MASKKLKTTDYDSWIEAKANMDYWKKMEADLRIKICDVLLKGKTKGTHTITESGYILKPVKNENISIDEEILAFIWDDLTEEEQACVKYKPSLIAKEYKECDDHSELDKAITVKPAMPSLSIEKAEAMFEE